jgi:glycosyltransferase involved in cell wall biosynthesis
VQHSELSKFASRYRFFYNPIRYTSLGLAVIEAMMIGMPIVALATTEMSTVIDDGISGFIDTDERKLVERMRMLLAEPELARHLGEAARLRARERFNICRFADDWDKVFRHVTQ